MYRKKYIYILEKLIFKTGDLFTRINYLIIVDMIYIIYFIVINHRAIYELFII